MFGILNICKPQGITSRQVVDRIYRIVNPLRAGHAGTLDPLATGVLLVPVGRATRLIEFLHQQSKAYRGTFLLGQESDTEDIEGEVRSLADAPVPTRASLAEAAARLTGRIQQRPPAFSAIKVEGRRAYQLARTGKAVELPARTVEIHRCEVVRYEYPEMVLEVECGSGTYIRSLGRDLAAAVGTVAVMSALTRVRVGQCTLENSSTLREITAETLPSKLLPPRLAISHLPQLVLTGELLTALANGQKLTWEQDLPPGPVAVLNSDGLLRSIVEKINGQICPKRNFPVDD